MTATLDSYHWHEALHTTHLVEAMFDAHVWEHPVIQHDPQLKEQARAVSVGLSKLYAMVAATRFNDG